MKEPERPAVLHINSWAGHSRTRVTVIGETPKRYRVRFEEELRFEWGATKGAVRLVPKSAVSFEKCLNS